MRFELKPEVKKKIEALIKGLHDQKIITIGHPEVRMEQEEYHVLGSYSPVVVTTFRGRIDFVVSDDMVEVKK